MSEQDAHDALAELQRAQWRSDPLCGCGGCKVRSISVEGRIVTQTDIETAYIVHSETPPG